jgi:hypothetical protein
VFSSGKLAYAITKYLIVSANEGDDENILRTFLHYVTFSSFISLCCCFTIDAVYDADVYPKCGLDWHYQFCSAVAHHSCHAEFRVQRRGFRAAISIYRHRMGFLFEP